MNHKVGFWVADNAAAGGGVLWYSQGRRHCASPGHLSTQDPGIILPSSYDTYSELQNKACPGLLELSMSLPFWQIGSILADLSAGRNMYASKYGIALFESPVMWIWEAQGSRRPSFALPSPRTHVIQPRRCCTHSESLSSLVSPSLPSLLYCQCGFYIWLPSGE